MYLERARYHSPTSFPRSPPRFLCDEMLGGIGRWLRAAGYDTLIAARGVPDHRLVETARAEGRVMLTRDRGLAARLGADGAVALVESEGLAETARELHRRFRIDWLLAPFTRCLKDNSPLEPAGAEALARVPPRAKGLAGPVRACPDCRRVYWPGGHERRMRAVLARWQAAPEGSIES